MSIEFAPNPVTALKEVKSGIQAEANRLSRRSRDYFEANPNVIGTEGIEHSDGATNQRRAEVYLRASEKIGKILLQLKKDLVRAGNPYLSKLSDEEVDKIITKYETEGIF